MHFFLTLYLRIAKTIGKCLGYYHATNAQATEVYKVELLLDSPQGVISNRLKGES